MAMTKALATSEPPTNGLMLMIGAIRAPAAPASAALTPKVMA
jgi:hypothetical protein